METQFDKTLNEIVAEPETVACLIANRQGLCLGARGEISSNMAGIGVAISECACNLEPNLNPPTIILHSGKKRCTIQKDGELTAIIYKESK